MPLVIVGSDRFASLYVARSSTTGFRTSYRKTVAVAVTGPAVRVRSRDALRPRSAFSGPAIVRRDRPAASVSSVSGEGAKKPAPIENLLFQFSPRISADNRGLTN